MRRNWTLVVVTALIFMGTWLGAADTRFILWPLVLLLFAALLKRPTTTRAVALGALAVVQAVVTPEMAPLVVCILIFLAAYEWYWRPSTATLAKAFRRTIWYAGTAAALSAACAIYMASRGAVWDVIFQEVNLASSRTLDASIPPTPAGFPQARFDLIALAPVAALIMSFAYAVVRLRLRRPFLLADWPMGVVALFLATYYSKFLTRMDLPHAYEPFMIGTPLMIYIVYRTVMSLERVVRRHWERIRVGWVTAHPVGLALLIFMVVYFWAPLHRQLDGAATAYRPTVAARPTFARVGYDAEFDDPSFEDLEQIVNSYLGSGGQMLDLTDEPALFYYFIGRDPASRWFAPDSQVEAPALQRNLIDQLRRSPPKLIVFDSTDTAMIGGSSIDGVPVMVRLNLISRWVLDHYRPLLVSHGRTIYALPGVSPTQSLHLHLNQRPTTTDVPFQGQTCNWGYAPTFLSAPAEPRSNAPAVPVRTAVASQEQVTLTGWAGDMRAREPAREVIATFNGRIVGRAMPDLERPDVPAAGYPAGFLRTGFQLSIPKWANATKELRVFAVGRDGSVAPLAILNVPAQGGVARIASRTVTLQPSAETGHVDGETATGELLRIDPPAGSTWKDYRWLEVDAPSLEVDAPSSHGFLEGGFYLSDLLNSTDAGHVIAFATLGRSPRRYVVPVSSCQQWYGYGSRPLFLMLPTGQELAGIRVIR